MTQKQGVMHGRDHQYGGADPAGIAWQSVGGGAGAGGSWAYAWGEKHTVAPSSTVTTWISLPNFYTNDPASFAAGTDSGVAGISVGQPGIYRVWFQVSLIVSSGEPAPTTKYATLRAGAGGLFFTTSLFSFSSGPATGTPYPVFTGGGVSWNLGSSELWDYETAGGTYPAPAITVGCSHNASLGADGYASIVIERLGAEIVGGIN